MSFFQPSKKRTTRLSLSKDTKKPEVKIFLDSSVDSISENIDITSKMSETNTMSDTVVQTSSNFSVIKGIEILNEQESLLTSNEVLPLPTSLQQELLHGHFLSEEIKKSLVEQGKTKLFPFYKDDETGESIILFLQSFISSKHQIGAQILDLANDVKSKTELQFVDELKAVIDFLKNYRKTTFNFKNHFTVDLIKLDNLFTKITYFKPESVIPAIIDAFWQLPNPDPAKLNQARSGWLYNRSQINNKPDQAKLSPTQIS